MTTTRIVQRNILVVLHKVQSIKEKLLTQLKNHKFKHVKKVQSKKPDTCHEFLHMDWPQMYAVLPLEREMSSHVRVKFSHQIERKTLSDTSSCANTLPKTFFGDLKLNTLNALFSENVFFLFSQNGLLLKISNR